MRHIAELHGGTVAADSAGESQGATFTVRLPLMAVRTATSNAQPESQTTSVIDINLPSLLTGLRLLVVDDEEDAREQISAVLMQYGAEIVVASSAREALADQNEERVEKSSKANTRGLPPE